MAITFHLSPYLAALVGGQDSVLVGDVNRTVGEALTSLWNSYPILHDRVWMSRKKSALASIFSSGMSLFALPAVC